MSGSIRDVRVAVWKGDMSTCYSGDVTRSDFMGGRLWYENGPGGCMAGELGLGLLYEDVEQRGYWVGPNIVEISTGDDVLQAPITAGATKLYVKSRKPYDPALGADAQQIYLNDGAHLTLGIPVTGVGTDGGGDFLTVGAPLAAIPGNPATIPAYGTGATVGRRVYAGIIRMRTRPNQKYPRATIALGPLSSAFDEAVDGYTIGALANVDVTAAVSSFVGFGASQWPHLIFNGSNFVTSTGCTFSGQRTDATIAQMIADGILAINTGDVFVVRVGHDRTPRWVRYYTSATNTYTYNQTFLQGTVTFEPIDVQVVDQDYSSFYNRLKVNGTTDPSTQQPYSAIVADNTSIAYVGRIVDGAPVTLSACNSDLACANAARALLNQNSLGKLRGTFKVDTRTDIATPDFTPLGLSVGDAIRGYECVTVAGFDAIGSSPNNAPDSEIANYLTLWTNAGLTYSPGTGPGSSNQWATSTPGSVRYAMGPALAVAATRPFVLSCHIDATGVTGGSVYARLLGQPGNVVIAQVTQTNGAVGRVASVPFTIPAGITSAQLQFVADTCTYSGGGASKFSRPMLSDGKTDKPYAVNTAAANVYGLVSSAKSVIDFSTLESWQEVSFNPIEPSWMAAVNERANAAVTALHNNTGTTGTIAGYIVSAAAFPPTYSTASRVLSTPAFAAQFGVGGAIIAVPAQTTLTLPANATSWIFLSPGGTWSTSGQPIPVAGSIMYGYATTNATGIVGFTPLAAVGVVIVGTSQGAPMPDAIRTNGPTYNGASCALGTQVGGAASASQPYSASFADWSGTPPDWFDAVYQVVRNHATGALIGDPVAYAMTTNVLAQTAQLPAGVAAADIGFFFLGHDNRPSITTWPPQFANIAVGAIANTAMQKMPSTAAPGATGTLVSRVVGSGTNQVITVSVTISTLSGVAAAPRPPFLDTINMVVRDHGATAPSYDVEIPYDQWTISGSSIVNTSIPIYAAVGNNVDVGFYCKDQFGQPSAIVWPSGLDSINDPNSTFIDPGTGEIKVPRHPLPIRGVPYRNVVVNGNFQLAEALAANGGWSSYLGATGALAGAFGSLTAERITAPANGGIYQVIPVKPNTTYSFAALLYLATAGQSVKAWVLDNALSPDLSNDTQPSGSLDPAGFYRSNAALNGSRTTTTVNAWKLCQGQFASGNRTSVTLLLQGDASPTTFYAMGVMVWENTKSQDYVDGDPLPNSVGDSQVKPNAGVQATKLNYVGGGGATVETLRPAEAGANVTETRTSADTAAVSAVPAAAYKNKLRTYVSVRGRAPYYDGAHVIFQDLFQIVRTDGTYKDITAGTSVTVGLASTLWVNMTTGAIATAAYNVSTYSDDANYGYIGFVTGGGQFSTDAVNSSYVAALSADLTDLGSGSGVKFSRSTSLNAQGSAAPAAGVDNVPSYTSTSTSITVTVPAYTFKRADGSTVTTSSTSLAFNSLSPSTAYHFNVWIIVASVTVVITKYSTSALTPAQRAEAIADGLIPVYIDFVATTPVSGSGSGGGGAGGGGGVQCPAVHQMIETRERGFVRADALVASEHLRDPEDGWNAIERLAVLPTTLYRIVTRDESVDVNETHGVLTADGVWTRVTDLCAGMRLRALPGAPEPLVLAVECLGAGEYVAIQCERHRYVLGRTIAHNVTF